MALDEGEKSMNAPRGILHSIFSAGNAATASSTLGLTFGPSTILVFGFGIFVAPLSSSFGWQPSSIALGSTIISIMAMLAAPLQGYLIDRFGARPVVLTSVPLFAAGLCSMSMLSGDIRMFYAMCALLPMLGLGLWSASYLRAVSTWYDKHLGLAIGIANGGIGIGAAVVPIIATTLMQGSDWGRAYIGLGLIVLVVAWPINFFCLREAPSVHKATQADRASQNGPTFSEIARARSFKLLLGAFACLGFVNVGLIVNQVPLLIKQGVEPARAALAQATLGIAILVARFLCGVLLDRVPAPGLMAAVSLGGMMACVLYAAGASDFALVACPILIGAVIGAEFDVLSFIIKKYFGIPSFGRVYGVVFALFQLGAAAGAALLPLSRQYTNSYSAGLIVFAGFLLIGAACFAFLRSAAFVERQPESANLPVTAG